MVNLGVGVRFVSSERIFLARKFPFAHAIGHFARLGARPDRSNEA